MTQLDSTLLTYRGDNAMCESFFATLECELIEHRSFRSHAETRMAIFDFIEGWYNPRRRQRCDELVVDALVVPFGVIVHDVFGYRCPQVSLTERYETVETFSTYGENESFRVGVQIRTIGGKAQGV